uniref:Root UVB sensitive protein C-terminal domain-containing protein n=1 Tax=Aegilops tauschii subsp. strangulata TaxID=200361 RepID=A0A453INR6_AEGTS
MPLIYLQRRAAKRHLQQCQEWDWECCWHMLPGGMIWLYGFHSFLSQYSICTANYKAVQSLSLSTLNYERTSILLQYFMEHGEVLTPEQVSKQEHILPFWSSWRKLLRVKLPHELVHLGAKASMLAHSDMLLIAKTRSYYTNANYFLLDKDGSVCIFIHKQAVATDVLKSFVHGLVLARFMQKSKSCHTEAHQWMDEKYNTFISKLKVEGYSTERLLSHSIVWKAHWVYGPLDEKTK